MTTFQVWLIIANVYVAAMFVSDTQDKRRFRILAGSALFWWAGAILFALAKATGEGT